MPSIFRSEAMSLWQLFLQPENAYASIAHLGEEGVAHFRDLNPGLTINQRKFTLDVKRCDELERRLVYIEQQLKRQEVKIADIDWQAPPPNPREIIDLEAALDKTEAEIREVNINTDALQKNFVELTELNHVLKKTQIFFDEQEQIAIEEHLELPANEVQNNINFSFVAGVILSERVRVFEQILWRTTQGNAYVKVVPIEEELYDVTSGSIKQKDVFIIFFQGEQLKQKLKKICEGFRTSMYPIPDTISERRDMALGVLTRIADLNTVLNQSKDHRYRLLMEAGKNFPMQLSKVRKMKAIYHVLNQFNFDMTQKALIGECWVADVDMNRYSDCLLKAQVSAGSSIPPITNRLETFMRPPTYYRTNKYTASFQGIVDSYGVANYEEVNPALYTIITFPFLFGVMFGDAGHGLIMTLFALWMVLFEKSLLKQKTDNEIWNIIFGGRYIILSMGIFSMYTGLIYNDVFSKSLNIWGSQWGSNFTDSDMLSNDILQMNPDTIQGFNFYGTPYVFGIDPIWQLATNSLTYLDSYKMKLSVILGVVQMMFGVFLSCFNHMHFREYSDILVEFIPEVIFLSAVFGYLDVLIIWKWFKYTPNDSTIAPNLLITLIDMFLGKDYDLPMYDGQSTVQEVLVIVAIVCVPWMLFIKPFLRRHHYKIAVKRGSEKIEFGDLLGPNGEFQMGEIFVHQTIHTIEYCLGCISNTASYLRLWALSLAHNQLSDVLWKLIMRLGLNIVDDYVGGGFIVWGMFAFWGVLTISILLIMEGLSAFLHALRLHWVEFMNKFYKGEGYVFAPLSFRKILLNEDEEEM